MESLDKCGVEEWSLLASCRGSLLRRLHPMLQARWCSSE